MRLSSPPPLFFLLLATTAAASSTPATAAQPPTAYIPIVTPAPDQDAVLDRQGFRQETFYTCHTVGTSPHCGWHVPIVRAAATPTSSGVKGFVAIVVGFAAGFAFSVS
ncbi:hypothetical protein XA68_12458 [Ophiocordyceps unilateralis]|uniref:Uncharacterized protein n=1 Tax=Ophiocordyceps unilateralis TaxID=268505 RepID=A0A2A9PEQ0_OPHUN|nr:hypothetical protein XA68_12458 [Ophiocordyceps unilateralis]